MNSAVYLLLIVTVCNFDKIFYLNIILQLSESTGTKLPAYLITFITLICIAKRSKLLTVSAPAKTGARKFAKVICNNLSKQPNLGQPKLAL